jgi:hypothetical protein
MSACSPGAGAPRACAGREIRGGLTRLSSLERFHPGFGFETGRCPVSAPHPGYG